MLSPLSIETMLEDTRRARLADADHQRLLAQLPRRPSSAAAARHTVARGLRSLARVLDPSLIVAEPAHAASRPRLVVIARWR
jgi:hypothetical protein